MLKGGTRRSRGRGPRAKLIASSQTTHGDYRGAQTVGRDQIFIIKGWFCKGRSDTCTRRSKKLIRRQLFNAFMVGRGLIRRCPKIWVVNVLLRGTEVVVFSGFISLLKIFFRGSVSRFLMMVQIWVSYRNVYSVKIDKRWRSRARLRIWTYW